MRLFAALLLLSAAAAAAEEITPAADLIAGKKFDRKFACVRGKTSVLFTKAASRQGNAYFTFWVANGDAKVKVFAFGVPKLFAEGDEVEACGRFDKEKHISDRVFYDELSASVLLKGKAIGAGVVDFGADGHFALRGLKAYPDLVQVTDNRFKTVAPKTAVAAQAPPAQASPK